MRQRRRESRRVRGLWGQLDFARSWALNASRSRTAASSLSGLILRLPRRSRAADLRRVPLTSRPGGPLFFAFLFRAGRGGARFAIDRWNANG